MSDSEFFFRNSESRSGVADAGNECPVRGSAARPVRVTMRKERDRPNLGRRIDGQTTRPNDHRRSYHSALFGRLTHTPLSGANVGGNNIHVSNFVLEAATLFPPISICVIIFGPYSFPGQTLESPPPRIISFVDLGKQTTQTLQRSSRSRGTGRSSARSPQPTYSTFDRFSRVSHPYPHARTLRRPCGRWVRTLGAHEPQEDSPV